jgi:hypothetical protein
MKSHLISFLTIFMFGFAGLSQEAFDVYIEPISINNAPGVHSFSYGVTSDGKWIIIGGRTDGLHRRQPFAAFLAADNNQNIWVVDPVSNQVWSAPLSNLSTSLFEQLQSTNQEFHQNGNTLYIIGGYGYSATALDHITYSNLTAIDLDGLASAIIAGGNITSYFRQIQDPNLAVTGGQLGFMNDYYYLCGGQYFEGRYNPMGPSHGPGFVQQYTNEIRKFQIVDNGTTLSIANFSALQDTMELHRRDYNMAGQIFPNGDYGFTMFSGVFNYSDLPFLNTVDVLESSFQAGTIFNQYLSHYHSAKVPIYDQAANTMHTLFFGGMSQYTVDAGGQLVKDDNVPFVKTISKVTRASDGTMTESKFNMEMPGLLGSGSEFIPVNNSSLFINNEIIDLNTIQTDSALVGYIVGGIESSAPNIFFSNTGTQSWASTQVFKVILVKNITSVPETPLLDENILQLNVFPNPSDGDFKASFFIPNYESYTVTISDISGKTVYSQSVTKSIGNQEIQFSQSFSSGEYIVSLYGENLRVQKKIIIK